MKRDYSGLQNGSDIRGVAIEGENPRTLGPEEAFCLSAAFGKWLWWKQQIFALSPSVFVRWDFYAFLYSMRVALLHR